MLTGKTALVTGAGRGIGRSIALALARQGAKVCVSDVDLTNAAKVACELEALGAQVLVCQTDISDENQVTQMVAQCVDAFGTVDILVNNAGIVYTKPIIETDEAAWDKVVSINLKGVFLCTKAAFPVMMNHQSGKIINIASVAGKRGGGLLGSSSYAASKGGVIAFTKSAAREGGPYGINVNAVAPAFTETDMTKEVAPDKKEAILRMVPLGRAGKPEDVAAAVCFLASAQADYITGEIMDVDGGLMMD